MKTLIVSAIIGIGLSVQVANVSAQATTEGSAPQDFATTYHKNTKTGHGLHSLYAQYLGQVNAPPGSVLLGHQETAVSNIKGLTPVRGMEVLIDAVATSDAPLLLANLQALGLKNGGVYNNLVSGLLPIASIGQAEQLGQLRFVRASHCQLQAGLVTTQGDPAMKSNQTRTRHRINGNRVRIGTISDSFDVTGTRKVQDQLSGDLPADVLILQDNYSTGNTDEGRAMAQIAYDIAPGASIAFHTAWAGQANFANGIIALANAGCKVIADDVIYYEEPMFADGVIAQAVDIVKSRGVAYFSSAGNQARQAYESPFRAGPSLQPGIYQSSHNFDAAGSDTLLNFTIPAGDTGYFVLQWDQPYYSASGSPGCASDLDLELYDISGAPSLLFGSYDDNIGGDPIEIVGIWNNGTAPYTGGLAVQLYAGPAPGLVKVAWFGSVTINEYRTDSGSLYGHANARGAVATGASFYWNTPAYGANPPLLNYYSSAGPAPIFFGSTGARLSAPEYRLKPEVVGPDGGDTTFFGNYDPDSTGFPNFFGTSASVVHVAGVAALLASLRPFTPDQIKQALTATAIDMMSPGFDYDSGYGFIQADKTIEYYFDLNVDKKVDMADFNILMGKIQSRSTDTRYDMNGDGLINIADARFMVLHFSQ